MKAGIDIFDINRDYNYLGTLDYTDMIEDIQYDTEYYSKEVSEEIYPGKLIQIVWYLPNGLRIAYNIKNSITLKSEMWYE